MEIEHVVINTFSKYYAIIICPWYPKKRKADGCWLSGNVWWEEGKGGESGKDNPAFDADESQGGAKKEEEPTS